MMGGQVDDSNGQSRQVLDVLLMDPNNRKWTLKRPFTSQQNGEGLCYANVKVNSKWLHTDFPGISNL
jgi:hypothetical protein